MDVPTTAERVPLQLLGQTWVDGNSESYCYVVVDWPSRARSAAADMGRSGGSPPPMFKRRLEH